MATEDIYGLTFGVLVLVLVTIIAVVVIWQGLASWRAVKMASREEAYRKLSESLLESVRNLERQQHVMADQLSSIGARSERIEKLLEQVE